jgi:V/A-type H+-transporting ATPase subunit E
MSAEKIIEQVKKDSQQKINQIIKDAESKIKIIIATEKKEANRQAEKIQADGVIQSENIGKILISKANQDAKKRIMNVREKIIDECFVKAHHKLSTLSEQKYKNIVTKLMQDGYKKIDQDCTVIISREIDKKIAKDLGLKVTGSVECSGGIMLTSVDGRITLDNTFDGILKREKDKIRIKVGRLLFS